MKKKNIFTILVATVMSTTLFLTGCGKTEETDVVEDQTVVEEPIEEINPKLAELNENVADLEEVFEKVSTLYTDGTIPSSSEMDTVIEQTKTVISLANEAKTMELSDTELDDVNMSLDLMFVSINSILELYVTE